MWIHQYYKLGSRFHLEGGLVILKKKESITENQSITCPNESCGKVFTRSLKATDVGSKGSRTYDACPYCLTEIVREEQPVIAMVRSGPEVVGRDIPKASLRSSKERQSEPLKASGCQHQLGYLSKRTAKEKIPEECMMCEQIVKCMLKM